MNNDKKHNYNKTGWGFIFLAVICVVLFLIDYRVKFIFNLTSISELGTIIGGTSGLFASLAGLFFVLENLELQRDTIKQQQNSIDLQKEELKNQIQEMKESNEYFKEQTIALKNQNSASVFFQLLENHRSLVKALNFGDDNGYSGLSRYYQQLKWNTEIYYQLAHTGIIYKTEQANFYPIKQLKVQHENIDQIFENLLNLINVIVNTLENSSFYHCVLDNSITKAEKYLLGLYIHNEKPEAVQYFHTSVFNYLAFFEGSGNGCYLKKEHPYFPYLKFELKNPYSKVNIYDNDFRNLNSEFGLINLEINDNFNGSSVFLKSIALEYDWLKKDYKDELLFDNQIKDKYTVDLIQLYKSHIISKFLSTFSQSKKTFPFRFTYGLIFNIEYETRIYQYRKYYNCEASNYEGAEASLSIVELNR